MWKQIYSKQFVHSAIVLFYNGFFYRWQLIGTDGTTEIGGVYKKYRGFVEEAFTSADAYLLKGKCPNQFFSSSHRLIFVVPVDLDVKMKAVALGSLFLVVSFSFSRKFFISVF